MNGRLYDPLLRRFLNADENIQDPHNTQNYNKYGYVFNNPLMYNDPSGELAFLPALIIGAIVGFTSYTVGLIVTDSLYRWNLKDAFKATFWSTVSAAVTFGIGEVFSTTLKTGFTIAESLKESLGGFGAALVHAGTHAISQGVLSTMQGGNFLSSAASGFFGSLGTSGFGAIAGKWAASAGGQIFFGALSGGIGAELTGGNFWQGAVTGGIVAGLNHLAHSPNSPWNNGRGGKGKANVRIQRKEPWDVNGDGILQKSEADRWWLIGNGQSITVDNSLIKWTGLRMSTNIPIKQGNSSKFNVETHMAFIDLPYETAATYGGTSFIRTGEYTAEVLSQSYHYKFRKSFNPVNITRDIMTYIGHPRTYNSRGEGSLLYGKDYMINYKNETIHFKTQKIRSDNGGSHYVAY